MGIRPKKELWALSCPQINLSGVKPLRGNFEIFLAQVFIIFFLKLRSFLLFLIRKYRHILRNKKILYFKKSKF